jgi:hypothetical protein
MRLCDLPVFSSNEPKGECDNVFSWDSTHILIWAGQGNGWQLVERTDVGEHV